MIRSLRLTNWRAYDKLDLELGPGATFVVASNGIGKTSLIMGAAWGLFGEASEVKAVEEIRGDADGATVEVVLRLPSGIDVVITRTVNPRGRTALSVEHPDGELTSQNDLDAMLAKEFGADSHVLAQLTTMIHGGAMETFQGEFDLQDHLAAIFGVTPLLEAARAAKETADGAASALRKMKTTQRSEKRDRDQVVAELESVVEQLSAATENRDQAVAKMNETAEGVHAAEEWTRFRTGMTERAAKLASIAERASSLLERPVTAETVLDALVESDQTLDASAADAEGRAASARGKSELINDAMSQLRGADALCPTCLRPMSEHEADRAEQEHQKHLQDLQAEIAEAQQNASLTRTALGEVRELMEEIRTLPVPLEPESGSADADLEVAQAELERSREEVRALDQKLAELAASGQSLQRALQELEEDDEQLRELEALYREEGIALAARDALESTGRQITEKYIEPLAQEVEARWKRMFGGGGLILSPEGHITRQLGGRTLGFSSLSGGEKVWALLLTRLLVAGASTRAPFVWLDEPLEHLDPRLRKVVAGTLAKAASGTGLRQVVVTTYESELARRLMEDVPSASLVYVTTSE
jgi:DNA repair exonuclease SbcCD ATPase subunit